jgi:hypothetical protein
MCAPSRCRPARRSSRLTDIFRRLKLSLEVSLRVSSFHPAKVREPGLRIRSRSSRQKPAVTRNRHCSSPAMRKAWLLSLALAIAHSPLVIAADLLFQRTWGGAAEEFGEGGAVAPGGSVFVVGTTFGFGLGDRDVFLLNSAADGTLLWQRTWGTARVEPNLRAEDFATEVAAAWLTPFSYGSCRSRARCRVTRGRPITATRQRCD